MEVGSKIGKVGGVKTLVERCSLGDFWNCCTLILSMESLYCSFRLRKIMSLFVEEVFTFPYGKLDIWKCTC